SASFLSMRPFVRSSVRDEQKVLASFMIAGSDPDNYGRLVVYELDQGIDGPSLVASKMVQDAKVAAVRRELQQGGAEVVFGNLLLVPIDDVLLYLRPMYVEAENTPVPELNSVILALGDGDRVVIHERLEGALAELFRDGDEIDPAALDAIESIFEEPVPTPDDEPASPDDGDDEEPATDDVGALLAEADALFAEADAILEDLDDLGDLADYQATVEE